MLLQLHLHLGPDLQRPACGFSSATRSMTPLIELHLPLTAACRAYSSGLDERLLDPRSPPRARAASRRLRLRACCSTCCAYSYHWTASSSASFFSFARREMCCSCVVGGLRPLLRVVAVLLLRPDDVDADRSISSGSSSSGSWSVSALARLGGSWNGSAGPRAAARPRRRARRARPVRLGSSSRAARRRRAPLLRSGAAPENSSVSKILRQLALGHDSWLTHLRPRFPAPGGTSPGWSASRDTDEPAAARRWSPGWCRAYAGLPLWASSAMRGGDLA